MISENYSLTVLSVDEGERLDKFLSKHCSALTRQSIQRLIEAGHIKRNGHHIFKASAKVKMNDVYEISVPLAEETPIEPQIVSFGIVYEDNDVIVVDKPAGLVVHPAVGHKDKTLVNGLIHHCAGSLSGIGGVKRPGIVHRLDKDTSGLMIVAKNDHAHQVLSGQFSDRTLSRTYVALVWGLFKQTEGIIDEPIGRSPNNRQKMAVNIPHGKEAITHYTVLKQYRHSQSVMNGLSLVECRLKTGRTHQIRVHLTHIGHSIIGDPVYGKKPKQCHLYWPTDICGFPRQALHAVNISFTHPLTQTTMHFSSPLPDDFQSVLKMLE